MTTSRPVTEALPPAPSRETGARYPAPPGARYLLPCHYLGAPGLWEYVLIDIAQARRWLLLPGRCTSYVTHPVLRSALETIIGFCLPPPRRGALPVLGYQDDALIFQVEGYETLPDLRRGDSRRVQQLVEDEKWTLGLLRRLA